MRAVLDTNVLVSGIFFGGIPGSILEVWTEGGFELCLTPLIFDEYLRVCERLGGFRPELEYRGLLAAILGHSTLIADAAPGTAITTDPDDDKFMLCAKQIKALVVSGDQHLLDADGWSGVEVLTPRAFLTRVRT